MVERSMECESSDLMKQFVARCSFINWGGEDPTDEELKTILKGMDQEDEDAIKEYGKEV